MFFVLGMALHGYFLLFVIPSMRKIQGLSSRRVTASHGSQLQFALFSRHEDKIQINSSPNYFSFPLRPKRRELSSHSNPLLVVPFLVISHVGCLVCQLIIFWSDDFLGVKGFTEVQMEQSFVILIRGK